MTPDPPAAGDQAAAKLRFARVLATGATGFVGGAVVRALRGAVGRVDAVINAAQATPSGRLTAAKVRQIRHADHVMTAALASACAAAGKRLVYTSGYFSYGDRGDDWITTQTPFDPSPLGVGHAAEVQALRRGAAEGLDLVVVAPGFVYGPGGLFRRAFRDQATGTIPPAIMSLIIGKPLVTSCRVANTEARDQLGWAPADQTVGDGLPRTVAQLTAIDAGA